MKPRGPSEAEIQKACDDFLELDGWRIIKTDLPHLRGLGVQEKGMPDRLYLRYWTGAIDQTRLAPPFECWVQHLWVEWKKRSGKLAEHQRSWIAGECAHGAIVIVAGVDFEASVDGFKGWYDGSGLARHKLTLQKP